jgi:CheY-like chemotaxis protein
LPDGELLTRHRAPQTAPTTAHSSKKRSIMNVFVSYQRADSAMAAHALCYALRHGGHDAFVDTGDIGAGQLYRQVIANAVTSCNLMLALIGPAFAVQRLAEPTSVVTFEWQRARFHGTAFVPVLIEGATLPGDAQLPPPLRWITRHNALTLRLNSLAADIAACVAAVPTLATTPRRAARVLWVDDHPANNEHERKQLRPHGIVFDCVVSTDEARDQLVEESYDLVITDLGRVGSSDRSATAGEAFLELPVLRDGGPPIIVYADERAVAQRAQLLQRGALEVLNKRADLLAAVLQVLGRTASADNTDAELLR